MQSMYNHMGGRAASVESPIYSMLLDFNLVQVTLILNPQMKNSNFSKLKTWISYLLSIKQSFKECCRESDMPLYGGSLEIMSTILLSRRVRVLTSLVGEDLILQTTPPDPPDSRDTRSRI